MIDENVKTKQYKTWGKALAIYIRCPRLWLKVFREPVAL